MTTSNPLPHLRTWYRQRCSGDDGALVAEFALVLPFLVTFVLGIFEFGLAYRNRINLEGSVRNATRTAAQLGNDRTADRTALSTFYASILSTKRVTVQRVTIYLADTNGNMQGSCATVTPSASSPAGVSGLCNVYSWNQLVTIGGGGGNFAGTSSCLSTDWDVRWCPLGRRTQLIDPPDALGIQARVTYNYITKLLPGSGLTMTASAVARLEPVKVS